MLIIPISSDLHDTFTSIAQKQRMIFMTGIPGTGKSLMAQQLSLIATNVGRKVHLLQYNAARGPFETEVNLAKYPEMEGVTDPAIRKAVGLWAREAVYQWHTNHPEPEHLLIGELPLIGNRLTELIKVYQDDTEPLLSSEEALFLIPVPSWEVREVIEARRAQTLAEPQNEQEKLDAPPNVLQMMWQEVNEVARQIGLTKAKPDTPYNPYIYGGVFEALLKHRQGQALLIDQVLKPTQSVYETGVVEGQLLADPDTVDRFMKRVESSYTARELNQAVTEWHAMITDEPKLPDTGPELRLPLPEILVGIEQQTDLSPKQQAALQNILHLPLDAETATMLPALDKAIDTLTTETDTITANVHKFDVYDSYFNVTRSNENSGQVFLAGLLQSYRNVLTNLQVSPQPLTVVEAPMLRVALETTLRQFI